MLNTLHIQTWMWNGAQQKKNATTTATVNERRKGKWEKNGKNILDESIRNERKKEQQYYNTNDNNIDLEKNREKKKSEKRTHYLDEMICVEIALGKINRMKSGSIKEFFFLVLVHFYNHIKLSKCLTASICR